MIKFSKNIIRKFTDAGNGIIEATKIDISIRLVLLIGVVVVILGYLLWPLEEFEVMSLVLAYGLMFLTEMLNTSIEVALARLHPARHHMIGTSKDIAAGASFISLTILIAIVVIIIFNHI